MKKLFMVFLLIIALFLFGYTPISAQTFRCNYTPAGTCIVSDNTCAPGTMPNQGYCSNFNLNRDGCNQAPAQSCAIDPGSCVGVGQSCMGGVQCCAGTSRYDRGNFCICISSQGQPPALPTIQSGPQWANCNGGQGIETAIGCIPIGADNQGTGIAAFFLRWGLGIVGGIALILIAYSGYLMTTSLGDPRKLQAGKELLTAAISGLVLIVLSAFLLDLIGVEILGIF